MSGHSKWHNIKGKKMATDAKRGKTYTKYARLIEIAAHEGGGDPSSNVRLRTLIDSAKTESVPNVNIDRAIQKGTGALKGDAMEEVTYEAYGPSGSAFIIECLTDNKNRTLSNVKEILSKNAGRFAGSGSVMWMFERKGVVLAKLSDGTSGLPKELELLLIDAGADDIRESEGHIRVLSDGTKWSAVRDVLTAKGAVVESAGLEYIAKQTAPVDSDAMTKVETLIEALEGDDDVSEVHTNAVSQ
ncbi:YebC/PmpR family DNA-binding transcriptional regulator [Candidatus Peribacteria bacterium]|nr:YebC/PmpR family DNA-binding transcriptional regulator [Candidatus Peribacteria bacterium]